MTYTVTVHEWPDVLIPSSQTFKAGGQSIQGGVTAGGTLVSHPEPGGRASLQQKFDIFTSHDENVEASWVMSKILNSSVFRVPIWAYSVQLVRAEDLGASHTMEFPGPIAKGEELLSNDWAFNPRADVTAAALSGTTSVEADLSPWGRILRRGHVIGFYDSDSGYDFAHMVEAVSYDAADTATITVSPPLRRDLTTSSKMKFRPKMMATCSNAREVAGLYSVGRHVQFSQVSWAEALV